MMKTANKQITMKLVPNRDYGLMEIFENGKKLGEVVRIWGYGWSVPGNRRILKNLESAVKSMKQNPEIQNTTER